MTDDGVHLAVLTVALLRDDGDRALLDLQLERIRRHTDHPVTIHVAALRPPAGLLDHLTRQPDVHLVDVAPVSDRGSREHAHQLDALLRAARTTPATHFATFDLDSFPIADGWLGGILADLPPGAGVAGVLRRENGDICLPHPSGTVLTRAFVEDHDVSFSPDSDGTSEFRRFLHATGQAGDTGIRLAYALWRDALPWLPLERTNAVDLHPVIAGVYGDRIFHLGAGTRAAVFRADLRRSRVHQLTRPLARLPVGSGRTRQVKRRVLRTLVGPAERRIVERNQVVAMEVRRALLEDPDRFLRRLRHGDGAGGDADNLS